MPRRRAPRNDSRGDVYLGSHSFFYTVSERHGAVPYDALFLLEVYALKNWNYIDLNGQWQLSVIHDAEYRKMQEEQDVLQLVRGRKLPCIPAAVPGNFELDLQACGQIPDVFTGEHVEKLLEYEDCHLFYYRTFVFEPLPQATPEFVCEGLDTFADIYVNGQFVYQSANMLIPHSIPVEWLPQGDADIVVHIKPTLLEAKKKKPPIGTIAMKYNGPSLYVRKAAHMFGWDITPRIISGGIWRPVRLEYRPEMRIEEVYLVTTGIDAQNRRASVILFYSIESGNANIRDFTLNCRAECEDGSFAMSEGLWFNSGRLHAQVENACLWWPKGRGMQSLYTVTVSLEYRGKVVDTYTFKTGLRTVELDYSPVCPEYPDGEFDIKVNHESLFILGTNWVPADVFHSRDVHRIADICELIDDIGCNAIRCWGGNVYEDDVFYDICDQKGIVVWQDFAMACGIYPQDAFMQEQLRTEAECIVKKLRQHPSLCIWAGDNECDQAFVNIPPARDPNKNVLTRKVIPEVLFEQDYFRPYIPSSPYMDEVSFAKKTGAPEDHLWGPRDYYKGEYYKSSRARFASEIGYHGCPSPESVKRFITAESLWPPDNRQWLFHATSPEADTAAPFGYRNNLMKSQIFNLFGLDMDSLEAFSLASQVSQSEAMKFFIEMFRSQKGLRRGIIWWNIMDGWPQFSDAVVDYYFTKKLAYWVIKRSQYPVCMMISDAGSQTPVLFAVNDTKKACAINYHVYDAGDGRKLIAQGAEAVEKDGCIALGVIESRLEQTLFIIEYEVNGQGYKNHYLSGKPAFDFQWVVNIMKQENLLQLEGFGDY